MYGIDDLFIGFSMKVSKEHRDLGYLSGQIIEEEFARADARIGEAEDVLDESRKSHSI